MGVRVAGLQFNGDPVFVNGLFIKAEFIVNEADGVMDLGALGIERDDLAEGFQGLL
jgi:hypothetical protein